MKNIYKFIAIAFFATLNQACSEDWLDVKPSDSLPSSGAILNYADAVSALNGVYDGLQGESSKSSYYAARMFYYGDVRGDDMQARTQGMRSSSCYEMAYTAEDAPAIWLIPYNVIRRANNLIKAIDGNQIVDATEDQKGNLKAQALVVRALAHFDLVRIYGLPYTIDNGVSMGVPIVTTPLASDQLPKRSSVAQVYGQIIMDLTDAISLGKLSTEKTLGYINAWVAKGILSRVYLYMGDNAKVLSTASDIITNSPYRLWTNAEYVGAWSKGGSSEMMFEVVNNGNDDWADRESIAYLLNEEGYADIIITKNFAELMKEDQNDVRNGILLPCSDPTLIKIFGNEKVFLNKFPGREDFQPTDVRVNNLPLLRLSEIYLNAAEAAVKLNDPVNAAKYLNPIVLRANPNATNISTSNVTLERVLKERRKELVGEGQRFFDLMRNNLTCVRYTNAADMGRHYALATPESRSFGPKYFRAILPIPKYEVDANVNLSKQQNPGY